MHPKCRTAVNAKAAEAGRQPLTDAEVRRIDDAMSATMRRLARTEPGWAGMTQDMRMQRAAEEAMANIRAEAALKVRRAQLQVMKTAETEARIADRMALMRVDRRDGWRGDMQFVYQQIDAIKRGYAAQLADLFAAAESGDGATLGRRALMFLFDAQNPAMTRDLALEVFAKGDGKTGNKLAQAGARAWLEVAEAMRQRFNAAGGDVGQLAYGYLPTGHDPVAIIKAGREAWAKATLPRLNRDYYRREDGSLMNDAEVLDVLRYSYDSIVTDGANKTAPGQFRGSGARANRGSDSRVLHFKDGEEYLAYHQQFGSGSMYDAMIGHIGGLSRDIGLLEHYGPNPEAQARLQIDLVERTDGQRMGGVQQLADSFAGPEALWNVLSGKSGMPVGPRFAQAGMHLRNVQVFSKLAGAVLSSITDIGTYAITVHANRLPWFEAIANIKNANTAEMRAFLDAQGYIAESYISDFARWSGDHMGNNWSGNVAAATMRLSLMNLWTDSGRRAYQLTHAQALARMQGTAWDALDAGDRFRLERAGFTAEDWAIVQRATPEIGPNGMPFLTPQALAASGDPGAARVAEKIIGHVVSESEMAILNPDLRTRAIATGGGAQTGTAGGEIARSVMQFKSFPIAMLSRHWGRLLEAPDHAGAPTPTERIVVGAALLITGTLLGAMAFQIKQVTQGKDPVDMTNGKFLAQAAAQGGGLGFVGDLLLTNTAQERGRLDTLARMLGPSFGSLADIMELTKGNIDESLEGRDPHAGAEALRFVRSHAPLVNLWYARTALNRAVLDGWQESLSPGYLSRIENLHRKQWGGDFWWEPGEAIPDRAPEYTTR